MVTSSLGSEARSAVREMVTSSLGQRPQSQSEGLREAEPSLEEPTARLPAQSEMGNAGSINDDMWQQLLTCIRSIREGERSATRHAPQDVNNRMEVSDVRGVEAASPNVEDRPPASAPRMRAPHENPKVLAAIDKKIIPKPSVYSGAV